MENQNTQFGTNGRWVPIDVQEIPEGLSHDRNNPTLAADGSYYYVEEQVGQTQQPIASNMNNAIPTPSQIVQLPPIVQPIAMVPYTTQNQPLVQYDSNYRPPVERTAVSPEPIMKAKPYATISAIISLLSIVLIAIGCLFTLYTYDGKEYNLIGCVNWLMENTSMFSSITGGDMTVIFVLLVPILYILVMVFSIIIMINALVHLGKMKPLRKVNGWNIASLIFSIVCIVFFFLKKDIFEAVGIGAYIVAGIALVMFILPLFINRKAKIVDGVASKETFIIE